MHISLDSALGRQRRLNSVGESVFQIAPDAAAGYSLRSLTGGDPSVVRVRRESDNGERDFRSSEINSGSMVRWVNEQITPPLDLRELTATGRDGPIIEAAAAYSLRNLSDSYAGDVVEVRRNSDGALKDFKASEVTDGTLEAWVNTSFANALPLDTAGAAAAAYSLRNLSSSYTGSVVEVRRNSDGALRSFTAAEVTDGTLVTWVTTSLSNGVFINNGYETFSGASASGFTASNTTSAGFANSVIPAGVTGDRLKVSFDIVVVSGSPKVALRATTSTGTASNNLEMTTSGSYTATLTATGSYSYVGVSEGDVPSEFTISNFQIIGQDGFVSKWYDQSGNDKHATQGTPASQPKIVDGGSLVTGGLVFDGTSDFLQASIGTLTQPISGFSVFKNNSLLNSPEIWDSISPTNRVVSFAVALDDTFRISAGVAIPSASSSQVDGTTYLRSDLINTTASEGYVNGTLKMSGNAGTNSMEGLTIGARYDGSVNFTNGSIAEVIIYNSDQSDKRRAIEENIGSNYGITLTSSKDGTVSKWYDQSTTSGVPNANHAVQTDAASQPKIVDGGSLVTQGGLAAINFDSSSKHFDMASIGFGNTWSMFGVINATGLNSKILSQSSSSGGAPRIDLEQGSPDKVEIVSNSFAGADKMNLAGNINTRALISLIDSANSFTAFTNGLPSSENPTTINGSFTFSVIGSQAAQVHQELILYNSDQTDNRTALEANIGEVYGIAGIPAYDNTVNGFVETWYDQSGNGNNATQLTAGSQPKIVSAGSLVTGGLDFDGVDDTLDLSGTGLDIFKNVGYGQVFSVATSNETGLSTARIFDDSTTATRFLLGESNATAGSFRVGGRRVNGDAFDSITASTPHGSTENLVTGFANWSDAEAYIYQNGANVGTDLSFQTAGNTQNTASGATSIGKGAFDGKIREVIVYNTDQTANRVGIETNINNQYDIY